MSKSNRQLTYEDVQNKTTSTSYKKGCLYDES